MSDCNPEYLTNARVLIKRAEEIAKMPETTPRRKDAMRHYIRRAVAQLEMCVRGGLDGVSRRRRRRRR